MSKELMELRSAERMKEMPASSTLSVLELAKRLEREGKRIIHLEAGEPDFDTPPHIRRAAVEAMEKGLTRYTPSGGIPELREAIAERLKNKGIGAKPEEVMVTPGTKHAIFCALSAILDPGDEVIIPSPCWTYDGTVHLAGGRPIFVKTTQEEGFRVKSETVEEKVGPKTKVLLLNYPNNPTGATIEKQDLRALADLAKDHHLWVISDEIYDALVYEGGHASVASLPGMHEQTVYINGFSKAYAMTGWRLGYSVAPPELTKLMIKIQQATTTCPASFVQAAGVAALKGPQDCVERMRREYLKRRDFLIDRLNSMGLECYKPRGAFYAFPEIDKLGEKSVDVCERLLKEVGVAVVPGAGFGPYGEGHIRISYAASIKEIEEGCKRIEEMISRT